MKKVIYLDNNATTKVDKVVFNTMKGFFTKYYFNPSSIYYYAQFCRGRIESARKNVAKLINASPDEIFFTSGGTEANNTVLKGVAFSLKDKGNHIITSQIEHPSVLNTCKFLQFQGYKITFLPVNDKGIVDLNYLNKSIKKGTILISIMSANNETGVIQPIDKIGAIAKEYNIYFHTDAVQSIGKMDIDVKKSNITFLSLSAHKFYGPKGIGAMYIKKGSNILPLLQGGEQEKHFRAGTENVASIIGLGKAAELVLKYSAEYNKRIEFLRDKLQEDLLSLIPDIKINGDLNNRTCNTLNISIKGIDSQELLMLLDRENFYLSAGSACSSGLPEPSYVLKAMGVNKDYIRGTLRISLSKYTSLKEIVLFEKTLKRIVSTLRKIKK